MSDHPVLDITVVARIVRAMLRAEFGRSVKFSVRANRPKSSIIVFWQDGPTETAVRRIIGHMHSAEPATGLDEGYICDTTVLDDGREVMLGNLRLDIFREVTDDALDWVHNDLGARNDGWTFGGRTDEAALPVAADEARTLRLPADMFTGRDIGLPPLLDSGLAARRNQVVRAVSQHIDFRNSRP